MILIKNDKFPVYVRYVNKSSHVTIYLTLVTTCPVTGQIVLICYILKRTCTLIN